jgi:hypothetical protein
VDGVLRGGVPFRQREAGIGRPGTLDELTTKIRSPKKTSVQTS